ncbi:MAG: sigma-70 family RNA polymerase sigma factor [Bacteroidales bacterium]|nr:sigma-70 family RNA polymerase sigma factor [Bacteroidales bacterium]
MTREEATAFYRKHYRRVFNICLRIVGDSADAEEIMQDTLLKYIADGPAGLSEQQTEAWLARTAIRKSLDVLRARKRSNLFKEELRAEQEEPAGTEEVSVESLTPEAVAGAIKALGEPYNIVLGLVLIEGLDYEEVSACTGQKQTTIRSSYSRGLAKLRTMLSNKRI